MSNNFAQVKKSEFRISSSSFKEGEIIPVKFTCDGENTSPQLNWDNVPRNTKSFALIHDDPDAPVGDWVHWLVYNIPANVIVLPENSTAANLPDGVLQGMNDWKRIGYGGPCPPLETHRYFYKLYALNSTLQLKEGATKKQLLEAMKGHILAEATLIGKYKRKR